MEAFEPKQEFDGYRLTKLLGKGGMGAVYLADDTQLDRPVAVKFILTEDNPSARKRFMLEARAVARLQHPNVVSIYSVGEVDKMPYLVSEFIRGTSLDKIDLPVSYAHALKIGIGISRGLAAAHRRGVVHRDIKPANAILSDDGEVKLLDFGIAKLVPQLTEKDRAAYLSLAPAPVIDDSTADIKPPPRADRIVAEVTNRVNMHWAEKKKDEARQIRESLTSDNVLLGTPQFMAPEIWLGEPSDFQSDIFSFGMLMYTLCAGRPGHTADSVLALRHKIVSIDVPPLLEAAPHIDQRFAAAIDRCLYRDRTMRFASINEVRSILERLQDSSRKTEVPKGNPYRGLYPFEAEHKTLFFGRDSEIRAILDRMETETFVLAVGDSGVGKSSLCRAGVLPRLGRNPEHETKWTTVCLIPGRHPLSSLCTALAPFLSQTESSFAAAVREDPGSVARAFRAATQEENTRLAIFIDQLEELSTIGDKDEVAHVCLLLQHLIMPSPNIRVLATARSDYLGRLACLPHLCDEISRALYFVNPLSEEGIREAVTGPAEMTGVTFESQALVDELVSSMIGDGGGLPLLQFALAELWRLRDIEKQTISKSALDKMGGVSGALTGHADTVLYEMLPKVRGAAKTVLLHLVTAEGTRARKTEDELCESTEQGKAALEALVRGRLLTAKAGSNESTYEIAHEYLICGWNTLAGWLSNDAERRQVISRLQAAAKEWERLGHSRQALWSDKQLTETVEMEISLSTLPALEQVFLLKSKRSTLFRKIRFAFAIIVLPAIALLIWGGLKLKAERDINHRVDLQTENAKRTLQAASVEQTAIAMLRNNTMRLFDEMNPDAAEQELSKYSSRRRKVEQLYRKAAEDLEAALMLSPMREDVREEFTALFFKRALLAEEGGAEREQEELLQRMSLYDKKGVWKKKWTAMGQVVFNVTPKDAQISVMQYTETENRKLSAVIIDTAVGPDGRIALHQGSYIARVVRNGYATTRYPFVVNRGRTLHIHAVLPETARIKKGFVYIPPGRFFFGSAAEDNLRRDFFHTVPLHEAQTGGYLISAHETTFADWFRYLDALPKSDRKARLPRVEKGGFQGALTIQYGDDGSRSIAFQPTTVLYSAQALEPVRYQERSRLQEQDWLNFPVFGISVDDALQYVAWLNASGTLPGARLCTDLEWERAARGADQREYPHGGHLSFDDANFDGTYGKKAEAMGPDEVGSHPASDSPFGLSDMSGNVWEWTRSSIRKGEFSARGGSYLFGPNSARVTEREITEPTFRDVSVGMRVCADFQP